MDVLQSGADYFGDFGCPYGVGEFIDQEQLQTHCNERHCQEEFADKTRLGAHSRGPETPGGKLPSFEGKRGSEVWSSCGAEGHYPELCTQGNDCHKGFAGLLV
jgi:hypothetical protein